MIRIPFRKSSSWRFVLLLRTNWKEFVFSLVLCNCFSTMKSTPEEKPSSRRGMQDSQEEALHVPLLIFFWFNPFFILISKGGPVGKCLISAAHSRAAGAGPRTPSTLTRAQHRYHLLINQRKTSNPPLFFVKLKGRNCSSSQSKGGGKKPGSGSPCFGAGKLLVCGPHAAQKQQWEHTPKVPG